MLSSASWLSLTPDPTGCQEGVCKLVRKMAAQQSQNYIPNDLKLLCVHFAGIGGLVSPHLLPKFQLSS